MLFTAEFTATLQAPKPCSLRQVVHIVLIFLTGYVPVMAQISCPAMAITRPKVSQKRMVGGFGSFHSGGGKKGQMGDFFATRTKNPKKAREFSEFSSKGGRNRFFRDMDEFATKRQGGKSKYKIFDEFSKRSRNGRFRDFDEFTAKRQAEGRSEVRGRAGKASRGFHRSAQRVRSQDSRSARGRANKRETSHFTIAVAPAGGEIKHREPEMGLWGNSLGKRGGKYKRKMVPMPEPKE